MANELNPPSIRRLSFTERLAIARAKSENEARMLQSRPVVPSRSSYLSPVPVLEMRSPDEPTNVRQLRKYPAPVMSIGQMATTEDEMSSSSSTSWSRISEQETCTRPTKRIEAGTQTEDPSSDDLGDNLVRNNTEEETAGRAIVVIDDANIVQPHGDKGLKGAESGNDNMHDMKPTDLLELNTSQNAVEHVQKRGRGRPKGSKNRPKVAGNTFHQLELQPEGPTIKQGRGQLRGSKKRSEITVKTLDDPEQQSEVPTFKRGRGRPRGSKNNTVHTIKALNQVEHQPGFPVTKRGGTSQLKTGMQDYDENQHEIESAGPLSLSAPKKRKREQGKYVMDDDLPDADSESSERALSNNMNYERLTKRLKVTKNRSIGNQKATNKTPAWENPLARGEVDTMDDILEDALDYIVVDRMWKN